MDRVGADFDGAIDSMRQKLGANAWPILIPLGKEDYLKGQIDVLNQKAVIYSDSDQVGSTYEIVDIPAEPSYCRKGMGFGRADVRFGRGSRHALSRRKPITKQDLKAAIRRQTIANRFVPVAGGSAFKNKGVQYLVDAVVDYLPSPLDIPRRKAKILTPASRWSTSADDNAKFCSLAFKLWSDPFVGKLVFFASTRAS